MKLSTTISEVTSSHIFVSSLKLACKRNPIEHIHTYEKNFTKNMYNNRKIALTSLPTELRVMG